MVRLTQFLKMMPSSTIIYIYIYEEGRVTRFGTAGLFLSMLEDNNDDGIVEYFIPIKEGVHLYMHIPETERDL